jgi:hypothetical protein
MAFQKVLTRLASVAVAAALVLPGGARAEDIKIQAMPLGSSWYVFGATLSKLLESKLPQGSTVEVVAKGGGVGNVISVDRGNAQIGLANVATAVWAWNGDPEVYEGKQYRNVRALAGGLNATWFNALVRADFLKKTGQKTLEEVLTSGKPVRIIMKPKGSTVPVVADMLFKALGTSREKIEAAGGSIVQTNPGQLPTLIRDGRADLYFESTPRGHPATTEATLTGDLVFLDLPAKSIDILASQGLIKTTMPVLFKGQTQPTQDVDYGTVLIANKDLSDDLAYVITKTLCENRDTMVAAHKAWEDFVPEKGWMPENTGIPLHPGAAKYYKERGWMK